MVQSDPPPKLQRDLRGRPTNDARDVASREKKAWVKYDLTALWASEVKIFRPKLTIIDSQRHQNADKPSRNPYRSVDVREANGEPCNVPPPCQSWSRRRLPHPHRGRIRYQAPVRSPNRPPSGLGNCRRPSCRRRTTPPDRSTLFRS